MHTQYTVINRFVHSLEAWMQVNVAEYAQMREQSNAANDLRLALCSRWLQVIEDALHPDAPRLLQLLADHAMQNIDHWMDHSEADRDMVGHISRLLLAWPQMIHRVLKEPLSDEAIHELLPFLVADCWPVPLNDEQLMHVADELEKHKALQSTQQMSEDDGNQAMFAAFREELLHAVNDMGSAVELMAVPDASADILFHFRDAWQDLLITCEEMHRLHPLPELADCCQRFATYLQQMHIDGEAAGRQWAERLDGWSLLFCQALNSECFDDLRFFLDNAAIWQDEQQVVSRPATADTPTIHTLTAADMDLHPDDDVHPEVLQAFFREAEGHAAALTTAVQQMMAGQCDQTMMAKVQRIAHTLKGAANTTGFRGIANLMHHVEDLIEHFYQQNQVPPQALLVLLMDVVDCLEVMVEHIQGREEAPGHALQLLQQLAHWWQRIQAGESLQEVAAEPLPESDGEVPPLPSEAAEKASTSVAAQEGEEYLHIPYRVVDQLLRQVGEITIAIGQMRNRFDQLNHQFKQQVQLEHRACQIGLELEERLTARGMGLIQRQVEQNDDFDPLELDQYNELHSGISRLLESIADSRAISEGLQQEMAAMDAHLISRERLQRNLQEHILQTRMTPFSTLEMRLQRIVRQTARKTGKLVTLECSGMDLMVDTEVLHRLADALLHILRNAVDHGIESPEVREQAGKPREGRIRLSISHPTHDVLICCEDDGQGLDFTAIRSKAEARGMLDTRTPMSDEELARLTLQTGFSTRDEVTQISGRGFGLDIVLQIVSKLKGRIRLLPVTTGGLRIEIRLPVTLTTIHALLVESEQQSYAIPSRDVVRVLNPGEGELRQIGNQCNYLINDALLPVHTLNYLLWGTEAKPGVQQNVPLMIRHQEKEHVVMVEHILGCHELIMKHSGRFFPPMPGVSGVSILNDSRVVSVLDLSRLISTPNVTGNVVNTLAQEKKTYAKEQARETTVMIVDDSLSVRRTLASLMQDTGYKTVLAIDGIEAIELLEQTLPDIILLDLELPRMNGLELSSYIRRQAHMQATPIIMITSRATEKHRQRAAQAGVSHYLVKPYQEDELLALTERLLSAGKS